MTILVPKVLQDPGVRPAIAGAACLLLCGLPLQGVAADGGAFSMGGDARVRYESIDIDPGGDVDRERYRARFSVDTAFTDSLALKVRLATGTGDPVSTNLNFGESFTLDDIQLDRAYLDWRLNDTLRLYGGKMKNPLYRPGDSSLNWDSDLNPEGLAAAVSNGPWFATAGLFRVAGQEGGVDSTLTALQGGRSWSLGDERVLRAGVSYFDYGNTRGQRPFYHGIAAGNTVDADGNYVYDYDIVELFAEYAVAWAGMPVEIFTDWVRNLDPGRQNRAFATGINVGSVEERGDFAASWAWHRTEADALIGVFTDSDLAGGNTDSRGHLLSFEYALTDHLVAGGTLILSEFGHFAGNVREFDRLMLDVEFRF